MEKGERYRPLTMRKMLIENGKISIFGNCSGELSEDQGSTCFIVNDSVTIDSGTGLLSLSFQQTRRLTDIVLSHQHFDHICSLPLLINTHYDNYLEQPLRVWSHPRTIEALRAHIFNDEIWPNFSRLPSDKNAVLKFNPIEHFQPTIVADVEVTLIPVEHTVVSSAVAVRSRSGGVMYSSDTTSNDTIWKFFNDNESFHSLFVECTFVDQKQQMAKVTKHYCPNLLHQDLEKLDRRIDVFLVHSIDPIKSQILAELKSHLGKPKANHHLLEPALPVVGEAYAI